MTGMGNNKKEELAHALYDADRKKTPESTKANCNSYNNFILNITYFRIVIKGIRYGYDVC